MLSYIYRLLSYSCIVTSIDTFLLIYEMHNQYLYLSASLTIYPHNARQLKNGQYEDHIGASIEIDQGQNPLTALYN